MAETTFMPGYHPSWKLSHTAGASGLAWRLISNATDLFAMIPLVDFSELSFLIPP
jgi:hypothetical protein